ncbi:16S rRNA (guanine(966)-N(2))-methyltransferase RsmD [Buchnera aphidicola (Macrosiphoniella sanborni)]|uniref:Ribosomal RNA small subunit methyltransferase D n=1 Tax=Buchnera aphidicola (Macrosiphoniella sanborni) TaxID=1241865 RepID=A0A4D6YAY2_9GAMM|nr:16S rRNA (guanine(966)-N(2))-methyltransferase RsmD [Buchnera aphidicola]QCI23601.1 16S rRNA (guanine(966)-N(2))-methyltransferase RsmD [Buchnera aphidicola (Macrosiphoniella sanborni)]
MNNSFLKKNNKVYISSGKFKGRKISFNNCDHLRPTINRIRETLFSWLSKYIKNAKCLDCFAGSGALGIEAVSHYAESSTLLEIEKKTFLNLKKNIKQLKISNIKIIHTNTFYWLKKTGKPYDIIFIDPPYYQGLVNKTINLLINKKWIKKNSLIYIEQEKKEPLTTPKNWNLYKYKTTNQIQYYLYIVDS